MEESARGALGVMTVDIPSDVDDNGPLTTEVNQEQLKALLTAANQGDKDQEQEPGKGPGRRERQRSNSRSPRSGPVRGGTAVEEDDFPDEEPSGEGSGTEDGKKIPAVM